MNPPIIWVLDSFSLPHSETCNAIQARRRRFQIAFRVRSFRSFERKYEILTRFEKCARMCVELCTMLAVRELISYFIYLQWRNVERLQNSSRLLRRSAHQHCAHGSQSLGPAKRVQPKPVHQRRRQRSKAGVLHSFRRWSTNVLRQRTCPHGTLPYLLINNAPIRDLASTRRRASEFKGKSRRDNLTWKIRCVPERATYRAANRRVSTFESFRCQLNIPMKSSEVSNKLQERGGFAYFLISWRIRTIKANEVKTTNLMKNVQI